MIEVTNPATGQTVGRVCKCTADDAREAFARARAAQPAWAATPARKRAAVFRRFALLVAQHRDELLDTIQDENGKNRASALEEVADVAATALYYAQTGPSQLKTRRRFTPAPLLTTAREQRPPKGVVGVIAPFNYPLALAVSDAIPAMVAGNAVVLKPDLRTPLSALKAAGILREAGLPDGVFNVVPGDGEDVGQAIVEECDFLMFTGSTATGTRLAQQAAARLIDYSMELGGKNAMIVAADANLDRAAERFIPAFVEHAASMRVGPGRGWDVDMGAQISPEHTDRIEAFMNDALAKGATALTGGRRTGPAFFEPTVLIDVPPDADLHSQEVFGPVVYVEVVDTLEEAVARANDTDYGLNSSVWAAPATARRLAGALESGTVNINEGYAPAWMALGAPMGGWKRSGMGRRHGEHGITKYTEPRNVTEMRWTTMSGLLGWAARRLG